MASLTSYGWQCTTNCGNALKESRRSQLSFQRGGELLQLLVDEGNVIAMGTPVIEVIDDSNIEAWIGLPPHAAAVLEVGQTHPLQVDGQVIEAVVCVVWIMMGWRSTSRGFRL